ncbi:MAG: caspase family protein [Myxococcota bacterium]
MLISLLLTTLLSAEPPRRAVLVGSNAPIEGRTPLRFAHRDARALADVLVTSGGFATTDVVVLLDAGPAEVLAALDQARTALAAQRAEGLLVFYYSGHADQRALFPGGEALPLEQLRARLSDDAAGVRIGIIDACRGGGWTQAKGLAPVAPFEVGVPALSSEGTALLAASSGLEDAHEAEALQGSFFTHHLVAGLRGAADTTGDGQVTLTEAFAYANRLTIRDTATTARVPQHPSFDLRLRGRQDVVLTASNSASTQLVLAQTEGPLEVVQLSTGVTVVEAAPGEQVLRLSLSPGPYLVRRLRAGQVLSKEVLVKPHEATRLEESSLSLVGIPETARKGVDAGSFRGSHELSVAGTVAPLETFVLGVGVTADYTWFFSESFGLRVLSATWNQPVPKSVRTQLERDFGVLPTAFTTVHGEAHSGLVWAPRLVSSERSELRLGVSLGLGAMFLQPPNVALTARPAGAASLELTWMFTAGSLGSLGARLGFSEVMAVSVLRPDVPPVHLATVNLALVADLGATR